MQDFEIDYRGVLTKYTGKAEHVIVPDDVIYIGKYAFMGCDFIRSVALPEEVVHIYSRAFLNCKNLESINLPPYLADIGEGAFCGCTSLKQIQFPRRLEKIDDDAFQHTGLEEITIPATIQKLGKGLFQGCVNLKKVTLPENMTDIPDSFFSYCSSLSEIQIPDTVERIGVSAFHYCKSIKEIRLPDSLEYLNGDITDYTNNYEFIYHNIRFHHSVRQSWATIKINLPSCFNAIKYYIFGIDFRRNPVSEKISILLQLFENTPEDERILRYFREHLTKDMKELIENKENKMLQEIIDNCLIQKENIDELIRYAIAQKLYEIQIMLTNYKREKIGFETPEEIAGRLFLD